MMVFDITLKRTITMEEQHPRKRCRQHFEAHPISMPAIEPPQQRPCKRYYSREEIEFRSASRKDGIDLAKESYLRNSYCSFLQRLGMKLHVSQVPIARAMLLCHQFYMRQSHAKNDWQTIATACMFLACKMEDVPCHLCSVVVAAYEMIHDWDPSAPFRIQQTEYYHKIKELILVGERLVLDTIAFDLDMELPYQPLNAAINRLNVFPDVATAAWSFVNDWFRTTLCLRFNPYTIAAASVHLAAKFQNVELGHGKDWWLEFGVSTKQLIEAVQEMCRLTQLDRRFSPMPPPPQKFSWPLIQAGGNHAVQAYPCHSYRHLSIW